MEVVDEFESARADSTDDVRLFQGCTKFSSTPHSNLNCSSGRALPVGRAHFQHLLYIHHMTTLPPVRVQSHALQKQHTLPPCALTHRPVLSKYEISHDAGTCLARDTLGGNICRSLLYPERTCAASYSTVVFSDYIQAPRVLPQRSWLHKHEPGRSKTGSLWPLTYSVEARCSVRRDDVISAVSASVSSRIGCLTAGCRSVRVQPLGGFGAPLRGCSQRCPRYLLTGQACRNLGQYLGIRLSHKTPNNAVLNSHPLALHHAHGTHLGLLTFDDPQLRLGPLNTGCKSRTRGGAGPISILAGGPP